MGKIIPIKDQLKNNMNKYIGVSVSLPLFSGLSRLTDVRKERFRLQRIRNENEQQRLSLYKEIDDAASPFGLPPRNTGRRSNSFALPPSR
mgnify:CR=1 FL=1